MSDPKRILLINYEYPPLGGGAGNAAAMIAPHLARRAEVRVVTSAYAGLPARETANGCDIRRVPALRRHKDRSNPLQMAAFMASATAHCLRNARTFRPDVSLAFFAIPGGPVALALRLALGTPYVVAFRGGDVPGFQQQGLGAYHRLVTPLFKVVCNKSEALAANSTGLATLAGRSVSGRKVHVVPNGVDGDVYTPSRTRRDGPPLFLFAGRLSQQKGVDVLVEAMARPNATTANVHLRIVGDGPDRPALEQRVQALGLGDRIKFSGWIGRDAMPDAYRNADACVLPSRDEGMPNVVLEAMASGLPVIATAISGNEELVTHGKTGLLVPADDATALSNALATLAQDRAVREQMGILGREKALMDYSWGASARSFRRLLVAAAEHGAR